MRWFAKPAIRERLVALHGSQRGFWAYTKQMVEVQPDAKPVSSSFIQQAVRGEVPTPSWLAVALTRVVEDALDLDRDATLRLVPDWFEMRDPEEVPE